LVTVMPRAKEWISAQAYMPSRLQMILEDHSFSQPQFAGDSARLAVFKFLHVANSYLGQSLPRGELFA